MKGLVIDEPWIGKILRGEKIWEMRTTATAVRGRIALIRKGSGTIVGSAELVDSIGPLDAIACRAHRDKHCIPPSLDQALLLWNHAWVLESARPLVQPVRYQHPNGAVIWVNLASSVVEQMVTDYGTSGVAGLPRSSQQPSQRSARDGSKPAVQVPRARTKASPVGASFVPVDKRGSWFGPHLARSSGFTVGAKGEERSYPDYAQALAALRTMSVPRWRRPNSNGNWGIVTGVTWCHVDEVSNPSSLALQGRLP